MTATERPLITPRLLLPDHTIQTFREAPIMLHVPSVQPLICEDVERYDQRLLINNNLEIHIHGCHGHFSGSGKRGNVLSISDSLEEVRSGRIILLYLLVHFLHMNENLAYAIQSIASIETNFLLNRFLNRRDRGGNIGSQWVRFHVSKIGTVALNQALFIRFTRRKVEPYSCVNQPVEKEVPSMKKPFIQRHGCALLLVIFSVVILLNIVLFAGEDILNALHSFAGGGAHPSVPPSIPLNTASKKLLATPTLIPTPTQIPLARPDFENGIVYPEWSQSGYGLGDTTWRQGIQTMQQQTHARWIEMPIKFEQSTNSSTIPSTKKSPSVTNFQQGVQTAKNLGYSVFVVPNLQVDQPGAWSGSIQFHTSAEMTAWFANYWQAYKPYIVAAQDAGADQLAIGTEMQWMQYYAPDSEWDALIAHIRSIFKGKLTYDTSWNSYIPQPPNWWGNRNLSAIGISEYIPLESVAVSLSSKQFITLFNSSVKSYLDTYTKILHKPLIVTEIGYRNGKFPGYRPWDSNYKDGPAPNTQAMALTNAISILVGDKYIHGIFIWGWNNTGPFDMNNPASVRAVNQQYSSPKI